MMHKLLKILPALVVISFCFSSVSQAQYVSARIDFWGTWKYTTDGVSYRKFGKSWGDLKETIEDSEKALNKLKQARSNYIFSNIFQISGGLCLTWNLIATQTKYEPWNTVWAIAGASTTVGFILDIIYREQIHEATMIYNSEFDYSYNISKHKKNLNFAVAPGWIGLRYIF